MKKSSTLGSIYFQGVSGIFYEKERNRFRGGVFLFLSVRSSGFYYRVDLDTTRD